MSFLLNYNNIIFITFFDSYGALLRKERAFNFDARATLNFVRFTFKCETYNTYIFLGNIFRTHSNLKQWTLSLRFRIIKEYSLMLFTSESYRIRSTKALQYAVNM